MVEATASQSDISAKVRRLHSLLLGSEVALAKDDAETALGLALRLLGFLDSESNTAEDQIYSRKILKQVHAHLDSARRGLRSDREILEQAKCDERFRFTEAKPIDLQRIKSSKFFLPVVGTLQRESDHISSRIGPTGQTPASTSARIDAAVPKLEVENRPGRSPLKPARTLLQSKINFGGSSSRPPENFHTTASAKPCEEFTPTVVASRIATPQQSTSRATTSKALRAQPSQIFDADFLPSPGDDEEERSLWNSYGGGRKRGRNAYLSKPIQRKARSGDHEDDSDENVEVVRSCYGSKRKQERPRTLPKEEMSDDDIEEVPNNFVTAKQKWAMDSISKKTASAPQGAGNNASSLRNGGTKSLGVTRRGVRSGFVPPIRNCNANNGSAAITRQQPGADNGTEDSTRKCLELLAGPDGELPDRLRNLEPKLLEHVSNEIMEQDPNVRWDDIAGLEHAKKCVTEMVIWPLLRPDIFQGCRAPGKGLLLFGPPGTGKTMIGKAIAGEAKATFFSISASSLTSKWIGEGEKLVRALFGVASCRQPAVIFIDEVDSLLSQRKSEGEHESSRRLKTQFLIEMEGCGSGTEQILLIGATNRPQELDEAARRRLSKRLYIPLPSAEARSWIVRSLLEKDGLLTLSEDDIKEVCTSTEGYSGSDMKNLVKEASMGPLREALMEGKDISKISNDEMRSIILQDFTSALQQVRPSVSQSELGLYEDWNRQFGSLAL